MADLDKPKVTIFDGRRENWTDFKAMFRGAVFLKGIYLDKIRKKKMLVTVKKEVRPHTLSDEKSMESDTSSAKDTSEDITEEKNQELFVYICFAVAENIRRDLLETCDMDGVAAWNRLCDEYDDPTLDNIMRLTDELSTLRMDKCASVAEYTTTVRRLFRLMEQTGDVFTNERKIATIFRQLPPRLNGWIYIKQAQHKATPLNWTDLLNDLVEMDKSEQFRREKPRQEVEINRVEGKKKKFQKRKETRTCFYCQKEGHLKRDCPEWKSKRKDAKNKEKEGKAKDKQKSRRAAVAMISDEDPECHEGTGYRESVWLLDSGATTHATNDRSIISDLRESDTTHIMVAKNGIESKVLGCGTVKLTTLDKDDEPITLILKDVLLVEDLPRNYLSVPQLTKRGHHVSFNPERTFISINGEINIPVEKKNQTYMVYGKVERKCEVVYGIRQKKKESLELWHKRLGHVPTEVIKTMPDSVKGMEITERGNEERCQTCLVAKMKNASFPDSKSRAERPGDLIHSDIMGPITPESYNKNTYAINFIDDYSRFTVIYVMRHKSEALQYFQRFIAEYMVPLKRKVKALRTDGGGEYTSNEFVEYCDSHHIARQETIPNTPQQNGIAERKWSTLMNTVRSLIKEKNVSHMHWDSALLYANYIRNVCPTKIRDTVRIPWRLFYGKAPKLTNVKVFGCLTYARNSSVKPGKLGDRGVKSIFLGFSKKVKGFLLYDPQRKKLFHSRTVVFLEDQKYERDTVDKDFVYLPETKNTLPREMPELEDDKPPVKPLDIKPSDPPRVTPPAEPKKNEAPTPLPLRRSERTKIPNKTLDIYEWKPPGDEKQKSINSIAAFIYAIQTVNGEVDQEEFTPSTFKEAVTSKQAKLWKLAMDDEYNSLMKNKTWTLVAKPKDRKIVRSKWTFRIKKNADGSTAKFKARLVAKGYTQVEGVDYEETFAPVVSFTTLRTLLAFCTLFGLKITQIDVSTAYLYASIDEEIYMEQPEGYQKTDKQGQVLVCKLNRSLYGLKQSGRNWNKHLHKWLIDHGFSQSTADPCLYIKIAEDFMAVAVYVDDMVIATGNEKMRTKFMNEFKKTFKITELGEIHWLLGTKIEMTEEGCLLSQEKYIRDLLKKYGMQDCRSVKTPIVVTKPQEQKKDSQDTDEQDEAQEEQEVLLDTDGACQYRSLTGSLIYAAVMTRPDITFAVNKLAQKMSKPTDKDWMAAKRVLRYLKGRESLGIYYSKNGNRSVEAYSDSDWAGDVESRKSTTGYVLTLAGAPITWGSKKQRIVALSSTEAEYIAASTTAKEILFVRKLMKDLTGRIPETTVLHIDNVGAILLSKNKATSGRSKHIDVRYHHITDLVEAKVIHPQYISTEDQKADCLTKIVGSEILKRAIQQLFNIPGQL
jgi:hypothetical protein